MEWIDSLHWEGILIGICTFLIIGLFHPIVVKAEYYWGTRCWWIFLLLGIAGLIGSVLVSQILLSTLLGVFSFSSFWTIKEVFEQRERVLLDHQGGLRTARTRAERLVPYESEAEEGI